MGYKSYYFIIHQPKTNHHEKNQPKINPKNSMHGLVA
jgi:hypothetical protein